MVAQTSPRASGMAESGGDLGSGESVIGLDSFAVEEDVGMHRRNGPGTAANGFYPAYRRRPLVISKCETVGLQTAYRLCEYRAMSTGIEMKLKISVGC